MYIPSGRSVYTCFKITQTSYVTRLAKIRDTPVADLLHEGLYINIGAAVVNYFNLHVAFFFCLD
jgi:hypothetical protein